MKKIIGSIICSLFLIGSANAYVPYSGVAIQGSAHDFVTVYTGANGETVPALNLCSTCHEMHRPAKMEPLWGRQNPAVENAWAIQTHGTTHLLNDEDGTAVISAADFVNGKSGMCMSCHDGVSDIANGVVMGSDRPANFGVDLTDNHSIGRAYYPKGDVRDEFLDSATLADGTEKLYIGCGTCHTMHHTQNRNLVRNGDAGGNATVCLNCHGTK